MVQLGGWGVRFWAALFDLTQTNPILGLIMLMFMGGSWFCLCSGHLSAALIDCERVFDVFSSSLSVNAGGIEHKRTESCSEALSSAALISFLCLAKKEIPI